MEPRDFKTAYKTVMDDHFPPVIEMSFVDGKHRQTLVYEKVSWVIDGVRKGMRYGENPGQECGLYKLTNGNLTLGEVTSITPGNWLASDPELLQFGKHPGKINITDADNALAILRYLMDRPCVAIMKHNNPSGVAIGATLAEAYHKANMADRVAAFGGCIALNREVDVETATLIAENYAEVVMAPEFAPGVMGIFERKKNLRVMKIANIRRLADFTAARFVDFKSLVDGGIMAQWSFVSDVKAAKDLTPATATHEGREVRISRLPTDRELQDMLFGWFVETGVSSNSVIYVKDLCTVGIGTGEQDRVGVAEIARDKAYRKLADRIAWERHRTPFNELQDASVRASIQEEAAAARGGLTGSVMISDAFFPFRDGVDVGLREGVSAVLQPGGSQRDHDSITACNEAGVAMMFTGQRCFKH